LTTQSRFISAIAGRKEKANRQAVENRQR
jgi:hypothetical protein